MFDASKAFDKVNYSKLFAALLIQNIQCISICFKVIACYVYLPIIAFEWGNTISEQFSVMNGVKQGGILLPILFAAITDKLLERLKNTGVGCHMGSRFVGVLALC